MPCVPQSSVCCICLRQTLLIALFHKSENRWWIWNTNTKIQSAFYEKVPAGGCRLWCGAGECVLVGGLKGCYWSKTVWRIRELHCYIQTENIYQLRVACSECTCTVYCGCCDNVLHWITLNSPEPMKDFCLLFVLWNKSFRMASSNSLLAAKSCACAYNAFLAGIFSCYADSAYDETLFWMINNIISFPRNYGSLGKYETDFGIYYEKTNTDWTKNWSWQSAARALNPWENGPSATSVVTVG
jgi:hypothetical protein